MQLVPRQQPTSNLARATGLHEMYQTVFRNELGKVNLICEMTVKYPMNSRKPNARIIGDFHYFVESSGINSGDILWIAVASNFKSILISSPAATPIIKCKHHYGWEIEKVEEVDEVDEIREF